MRGRARRPREVACEGGSLHVSFSLSWDVQCAECSGVRCLSFFFPQDLFTRAQGEVQVRTAMNELVMWGDTTVFTLTAHPNPRPIKLVEEWTSILTQARPAPALTPVPPRFRFPALRFVLCGR